MRITFEEDTLPEIVGSMEQFLADFYGNRVMEQPVTEQDATVPGDPGPDQEPVKKPRKKPAKKPAAKTEEPEEKVEAEPEAPLKTDAESKREALSLLMDLYNAEGDARTRVKELLADYGVKKFSEIEEAKGRELLADAEKIKEEVA